jgi:hypothetical protein
MLAVACRISGGWSPASNGGDPCSSPGQIIWELWWVTGHCGGGGAGFPASTSVCLDSVGSLTSYNPIGLHGLLRDSFTFFYFFTSVPPARLPTDSTIRQLLRTVCTNAITRKNSMAFSPQANYTDLATATCWRNLVKTFADRGMSRGQRGGSPTVVNLSFLDRSCYFSFK